MEPGMMVELDICVFSVAITKDHASPSTYLKMTQHIITARLTHITTPEKKLGAKDEVIVGFFFSDMPLSFINLYSLCNYIS